MSLLNIDWDFAYLEDLIEARGEDVIVETGIACTCRNGDLYAATIEREGKPASQRRLSCPQCHGDGLIFRNARMVRGLVTSLDPGRNRQLFESGYAVPGDAIFSPSLQVEKIGDLDRITMQFSENVSEGQVIMRGAANLEENRFIDTDLSEAEDRLWYLADYAIWCEDEDGVLYQQGSDFQFDAKKIRWVGNSPNVGKLYTVKYTAYHEWVVYATPFDRVDRNRNLGQRALIRKKHVAILTESPDNTVAKRQEEQELFTTRVKI